MYSVSNSILEFSAASVYPISIVKFSFYWKMVHVYSQKHFYKQFCICYLKVLGWIPINIWVEHERKKIKKILLKFNFLYGLFCKRNSSNTVRLLVIKWVCTLQWWVVETSWKSFSRVLWQYHVSLWELISLPTLDILLILFRNFQHPF